MKEVLADTGYSSGETYKYLEDKKIAAYIPACARYGADKEGFSYDSEKDRYACRRGVEISFKSVSAAVDAVKNAILDKIWMRDKFLLHSYRIKKTTKTYKIHKIPASPAKIFYIYSRYGSHT